MNPQKCCKICSRHLKGHGIWCELCPGYVHVCCSGLASSKDYYEGFACKKCESKNAPEPRIAEPLPNTETSSENNLDTTNVLKQIYEEVVHWKPEFIILGKNKAGFQFVETMNSLLQQLAERSVSSSNSMLSTMVFPHLILPKTKDSTDSSATKTIMRRIESWKEGNFSELFSEAKALHLRRRKNFGKKE